MPNWKHMWLWDTEWERETFDSKQGDTGQECPQCHLTLTTLSPDGQLLHQYQKGQSRQGFICCRQIPGHRKQITIPHHGNYIILKKGLMSQGNRLMFVKHPPRRFPGQYQECHFKYKLLTCFQKYLSTAHRSIWETPTYPCMHFLA